MTLDEAIAVFEKSAERTRPNAQTEAWAVLRAHIEDARRDAERMKHALRKIASSEEGDSLVGKIARRAIKAAMSGGTGE